MNYTAAPQMIQRIRSEYLEMPGLSLKVEQVQRLCGVEGALCQTVLETLVESGFLSRRSDGAYGRYRSSDISHTRQATSARESGLLVVGARTNRRLS